MIEGIKAAISLIQNPEGPDPTEVLLEKKKQWVREAVILMTRQDVEPGPRVGTGVSAEQSPPSGNQTGNGQGEVMTHHKREDLGTAGSGARTSVTKGGGEGAPRVEQLG